METLYITGNGLYLKKKSDRIAVKKDNKIIEEFRTLDLRRVLIFGKSSVSPDLMNHLAGKGIELAFLSSRGRFKFRVVPKTGKNIYLRMAQHDRYRDQGFRLRLSRIFVKAKLKNQRSFLVRYQRNRSDINLKKYIDILDNCVLNTQDKDTIDGLMGVEGTGARMYFEAYTDFQINNFTALSVGDIRRVLSPPSSLVKLIIWKSVGSFF